MSSSVPPEPEGDAPNLRQRIYNYLRLVRRAPTPQIVAATGIPMVLVLRALRGLRDQRMAKRVGPAKGKGKGRAFWKVTGPWQEYPERRGTQPGSHQRSPAPATPTPVRRPSAFLSTPLEQAWRWLPAPRAD